MASHNLITVICGEILVGQRRRAVNPAITTGIRRRINRKTLGSFLRFLWKFIDRQSTSEHIYMYELEDATDGKHTRENAGENAKRVYEHSHGESIS